MTEIWVIEERVELNASGTWAKNKADHEPYHAVAYVPKAERDTKADATQLQRALTGIAEGLERYLSDEPDPSGDGVRLLNSRDVIQNTVEIARKALTEFESTEGRPALATEPATGS